MSTVVGLRTGLFESVPIDARSRQRGLLLRLRGKPSRRRQVPVNSKGADFGKGPEGVGKASVFGVGIGSAFLAASPAKNNIDRDRFSAVTVPNGCTSVKIRTAGQN